MRDVVDGGYDGRGCETMAVDAKESRLSPTLPRRSNVSAEQHDNGIRLPNMPNLCFLTLKAAVNKFRVPCSVLSVAGSLPICMPRIEVLFVIQAEYKAYSDNMHCPDVDNALRDLQHLREVRFTAACEARDIPFERDIRKKLPMANDAALLSFCSMTSDARYHPMRHFSY
ncbi:hypothetical protein C8R44DRAFT_865679 [Mycena epipterygia]|nr:hypothetical protein C8R44DRAFT_865679 [Mycena epipterygia]